MCGVPRDLARMERHGGDAATSSGAVGARRARARLATWLRWRARAAASYELLHYATSRWLRALLFAAFRSWRERAATATARRTIAMAVARRWVCIEASRCLCRWAARAAHLSRLAVAAERWRHLGCAQCVRQWAAQAAAGGHARALLIDAVEQWQQRGGRVALRRWAVLGDEWRARRLAIARWRASEVTSAMRTWVRYADRVFRLALAARRWLAVECVRCLSSGDASPNDGCLPRGGQPVAQAALHRALLTWRARWFRKRAARAARQREVPLASPSSAATLPRAQARRGSLPSPIALQRSKTAPDRLTTRRSSLPAAITYGSFEPSTSRSFRKSKPKAAQGGAVSTPPTRPPPPPPGPPTTPLPRVLSAQAFIDLEQLQERRRRAEAIERRMRRGAVISAWAGWRAVAAAARALVALEATATGHATRAAVRGVWRRMHERAVMYRALRMAAAAVEMRGSRHAAAPAAAPAAAGAARARRSWSPNVRQLPHDRPPLLRRPFGGA